MKMFNLFKNIDILQWSAILLSFSFCLGIAVNSIAFVLFIAVAFIITIKELLNKKVQFDKIDMNYPLIIFFLIMFIRELTLEPEYAFTDYLKSDFAFLLLPLAIGFQMKKLRKHIPIILITFVFGCLFNSIINLIYAFYRGFIIPEDGINIWYFTYNLLSEPFSFQPIYLAFYYVFALLILNHYNALIKNKAFYYATFFVLSVSIFLLAARNAIVCLVILMPIFLILEKRISLKKLFIMIGVLVIAFFIAIQNPIVKNRILKVNQTGNFYSGKSLRFSIWENAIKVSKENPVIGLGKKQSQISLVEEYKKRELIVPVKENYNSHNQYLQTLMQYGIFGMVGLLLVFLFPARRFLKERYYLALFWIAIAAVTAITDSIFMRQWGIFSFAFFTSLFLLGNTQPAKKELES